MCIRDRLFNSKTGRPVVKRGAESQVPNHREHGGAQRKDSFLALCTSVLSVVIPSVKVEF